jgi:hypothetical protein
MTIVLATGYELHDQRSEFESRWRHEFPLLYIVQTDSGTTQPPIHWVPGALPLGIKRPGREADQSPPAWADAKRTWVYTSTTPFVFMV